MIETLARHQRATTAFLVLCMFCSCAFVAQVVMRAYPTTMDEYSLVYQSQIFATGQLALPAEANMAGLKEEYSQLWLGNIFSKYQPGYPALLAPFTLLGIESFANPAFGALALYLIMQVAAACAGWPSAIRLGLLLQVTPYFLAYNASFYAQTSSMMLAAATLFFFLRHTQSGALRPMALAGLCAGLAALVRPLDGFCLAVALAAGSLTPDRALFLRRGLVSGAPFIACALLLMQYHYVLTGYFHLTSYPILQNNEFHLVSKENTGALANALHAAQTYLNNIYVNMLPLLTNHLVPYAGVFFSLLALAGALTARGTLPRFLFAHVAAVIGLYNFNLTNGYPIYGARYWFCAFASLAVFAAYGLSHLTSISAAMLRAIWPIAAVPDGRALAAAIFALGLFAQAWQTTQDMRVYSRRAELRETVLREVEAACPAPTLIQIDFDSRIHPLTQDWPAYFVFADIMRNPFLNGQRLYLTDIKQLSTIRKLYPQHRFCRYRLIPHQIPVPPRVKPFFNWNLQQE